MKFGVFDHVDCSGEDLATHLENRIKLTEVYDRCGIHGYHIAEHHSTPLGYSPSPSVFAAAIMQRTQRLRVGPLIYFLPLYHPLRLIEEVAMLDNLSRGRFMLGVGPGSSPIEMSFYGIEGEEQRERYSEALEILLKGLRNETLNHDGKYNSFRDVSMTLRPYGNRCPELWYGVRSLDSVTWAARESINVVTLALDEDVKAITERYKEEWATLGRSPQDIPLMGVSRHIVVADTDDEAKAIARAAYSEWRTSFMKLWKDHGKPLPLTHLYPESWDELEAIKNGCAGSPETIRRYALEEAQRDGFNYLVAWFSFGRMKLADSIRSVELFSKHVMPAFNNDAAARQGAVA